MKKFIVFVLCSFLISAIQAQSEVFAGGEIFVEYAGDGTEKCGDDVPYHITFKFSRDQQSAAFPPDPTKTVIVREGGLGSPQFTVDLTDITYDVSSTPILCLSNIPVETESRWYRTASPVLIAGNVTAQISYANPANPAFGRNFQSPENLNINTGQRFFVKTAISTHCDVLVTGSNDQDPLKMTFDNQRFSQSVNWLTNDIVETFCDGKEYEYNFDQFIDKTNHFYQIDTLLLRDDTVQTEIRMIGPDTVINPDTYTLDRVSLFGTASIFKREFIRVGDTLITGMAVKPGIRIVREDRIVPISEAQLTNILTVKNLQITRRDSLMDDVGPDTDTTVVNQLILRQDICTLIFLDDGPDSLIERVSIKRVDRVGLVVILDTTVVRERIVLKGEVLEETVEVSLASAFRDDGSPVKYVSPYSGPAPFPTSFDGIAALNPDVDNVLRFTPQLPQGVNDFTAVVAIKIEKKRKVPKLVDAGGGNLRYDINNEEPVSVTFRQMRFIIGNRCNNRLPDFNSTTPFSTNTNGDVTAWEFNCAETELTFTMSEPMLASSLIGNGTKVDNNNNGRLEFRIFRGTEDGTLDDNPIAIDSIVIPPGGINNVGEFVDFTVHLYEPIGPGTYTMFSKLGTDGNTLKNRCGFEIAEDSAVSFTVNNLYDYDYYTDVEKFCYPADSPDNMFFDAINGLAPNVAAKAIRFEFAYRGPNILAPEQFRDAFYDPNAYLYRLDTSFFVPLDYPVTPITDFKQGFWNIGVGLDFSYTYNEVYFPEVCYGEDTVLADFLVNPEVTFTDIDLCSNEEWPVVRPTIDYTNSNVVLQNVSWGARFSPGFEDPKTIPTQTFLAVGGQSNDGSLNDSVEVGSFAFGVGNRFNFRSIVEFDNGCVDTNLFTAVREEVMVDIGDDSLFCQGEQYYLENLLDSTYLLPENMSYEWFLNNTPVPDSDTSALMITDEGWYKVRVTKTTESGSCFTEDSTRITIVEYLVAPEPFCATIDFVDGGLEQNFYIPPVPGADFFEARGIDALGNYLNNGEWEKVQGLEVLLRGAQNRLEVRGGNGELELDSLADCKYGPVGIAEACEIVVKSVNIFTPNGDGVNDVLKFHLVEAFPGSKLQIYNRWGRLIFESDNYLNDWDGEDHKDGTYFYVLDVNDPDGIQGIFKGNFTIVR